VVSDLVPLFRASDLRVLNLECAVGNLDASGEYPGKRWVLNMFPESLSALEALGVGVAGIANNHVRDFLEAGVQSTLDAAALYGIKTVGAGPTQASAEAPVIVECKGKTIGILAYTSVDGNYVNDQYPVDGETKPSTVAAEDAWSWVPRSWGWSGGGLEISEMERRIGSAWIEFSSIEDQLSDTDKAAAWSSLTGGYPELQDWVARRGHGGAARWNNLTSPAAITALKQQVDIVLVQLHSGFQYAEAPSDPMRTSAYAAVDAGADLIVGHHPHNLQGFEYYKNKLIAWSLGNLVFDQNFLLTFPSVVLRTVWEDDRMIQARLIPLSIDNYRPVPQADETARRVLRQVADCSATGATAARGDDAIVRAMLPSVDAIPAGHVPNFEFERHTVVLTDSLPVENTFSLSIPSAQPVAVSNRGLVWGRVQARATTGLWVGRSLFPYGSFENEGTGEGTGEAPFWNLDSTYKKIVSASKFDGQHALEVDRAAYNTADVLVRPVARISLVNHRWWSDSVTPADGVAAYGIHIAVRATGEAGLAKVRLDCYHFDDTDPTIAPQSDLVRSVDFPLDVPSNGKWHEVWLDIPSDTFADSSDGKEIRAVLMNLLVSPPKVRKSSVWFDAVDFVAWRDAAKQPETWTAIDWVKTSDGSAAEVDVRALQ
jgi:poly-gamma-glutamate capsule biosynthesis protein CapA/YwtB (metallophosphatase superfamily)